MVPKTTITMWGVRCWDFDVDAHRRPMVADTRRPNRRRLSWADGCPPRSASRASSRASVLPGSRHQRSGPCRWGAGNCWNRSSNLLCGPSNDVRGVAEQRREWDGVGVSRRWLTPRVRWNGECWDGAGGQWSRCLGQKITGLGQWLVHASKTVIAHGDHLLPFAQRAKPATCNVSPKWRT